MRMLKPRRSAAHHQRADSTEQAYRSPPVTSVCDGCLPVHDWFRAERVNNRLERRLSKKVLLSFPTDAEPDRSRLYSLVHVSLPIEGRAAVVARQTDRASEVPDFPSARYRRIVSRRASTPTRSHIFRSARFDPAPDDPVRPAAIPMPAHPSSRRALAAALDLARGERPAAERLPASEEH